MLSGPEGSVIQVVFLDFTNRHALQTRFVHHYKRLARVLGQVLFEYEYGTDMLTFAGASESGLELPERAPAFLAEVHAGRFSQPFASYAACIAQALEEDGDDVCGAERRIELPGGGIWVRVSLVAVRGSSGARESAVGCIMDVTPQHEDRARLLRLTQTDSLTGVLNKRTTEQRCRTLWENTPGEKPFALLLLDVDNFKQTNDRYGHPKGDAVLRCLGENLSGLFRRDDVVGRVGGDEFLMMMPGAGGEQAVGRARKIAQEMCRSVSVQCGVDVSGSIGVVLSKPGACAYEELLRRADSALYAAKAAGKGCYRVYGGAWYNARDACASVSAGYQHIDICADLLCAIQPSCTHLFPQHARQALIIGPHGRILTQGCFKHRVIVSKINEHKKSPRPIIGRGDFIHACPACRRAFFITGQSKHGGHW